MARKEQMDQRERDRLTMEKAVQECLYDVRVHLETAQHWDYRARLETMRYAHEALGRAIDKTGAYLNRYTEAS